MSIPPILGSRSSDITTSTFFRQSLDCWNQQILCQGSLHPTMLNLLCKSQALCSNVDRDSQKQIAWYANESGVLKRIGGPKGGFSCTMPGVETGRSSTLPQVSLQFHNTSSSRLKTSHLSMLHPKLSSQAETRSLQQRRLCDNSNFGTATSDHDLKLS